MEARTLYTVAYVPSPIRVRLDKDVDHYGFLGKPSFSNLKNMNDMRRKIEEEGDYSPECSSLEGWKCGRKDTSGYVDGDSE